MKTQKTFQVYETNETEAAMLITVWAALSDPTRRQILDLLRERPLTTGELSDEFPQSRFAVMKHLNTLESAGLISIRRKGKERWNYLNVIPLQLLYDRWVKPYQAMWASRMTNLKSKIEGDIMGSQTASLEQVELEMTISALAEHVWKALIEETTFWWSKDFYTNPKTKGFHIEPKLGGKMFEDWGDDTGVIWYEVFAINPPFSIDLRGYLAVPYGPSFSLLHIELRAAGKETLFTLSDSTIGSKGNEQSKLDGWKQLFEVGLKTYVENQVKEKRK